MNLYEHNRQLGWLTTAANRPRMIATFAATLAAAPNLFNSARLLEECRTFIRQPNGTAAAQSGAHDDCVMAMALALQVRAECETGERMANAGPREPDARAQWLATEPSH